MHRAGYGVHGIDPFIDDIPANLAGLERFRWHRDYGGIGDCDVITICVATPLNEDETPDLSFLKSAVGGVADNFGRRDAGWRVPKLLILESTSFPGTTNELVRPLLERAGLSLGSEYYLAYAPERVDPGSSGHGIEGIPRVVGGSDSASGDLAEAFYVSVGFEVHRVSTPEAAEMCKLLENVFRAVNIALVNEMSLLCRRMGVDIWEVVEAAATKPFGFMSFEPGPGMGGHCIPVDPFYLAWRAKQFDFNPEFIELAGKTNRRMPYHVVEWISEQLNARGLSTEGSRILLVGVAYKEDVKDTRESPALKIIDLLASQGAQVRYHDPHVPTVEVGGRQYRSEELSRDTLDACDCIVILTNHSGMDIELLKSAGVPIVDTRNALRKGMHRGSP
jgi:UDP-N-acetyl-D-glucosamine dehydrogenase